MTRKATPTLGPQRTANDGKQPHTSVDRSIFDLVRPQRQKPGEFAQSSQLSGRYPGAVKVTASLDVTSVHASQCLTLCEAANPSRYG